MPQLKRFLVAAQLVDEPLTDHYEVPARDESCALGIVLDELEHEIGVEPELEWVTIAADSPGGTRQPASWEHLPEQVRRAYERGLRAARSVT